NPDQSTHPHRSAGIGHPQVAPRAPVQSPFSNRSRAARLSASGTFHRGVQMRASTVFRSSLPVAALLLSASMASAQAKNPLGEPAKPAQERSAAPTRVIVRALAAGQPVTDLKAEE